jgi:hypothetical protein
MNGDLLDHVWWHWLLAAFLVGVGWSLGCALVAALVGWSAARGIHKA